MVPPRSSLHLQTLLLLSAASLCSFKKPHKLLYTLTLIGLRHGKRSLEACVMVIPGSYQMKTKSRSTECLWYYRHRALITDIHTQIPIGLFMQNLGLKKYRSFVKILSANWWMDGQTDRYQLLKVCGQKIWCRKSAVSNSRKSVSYKKLYGQ